MLPAGGARSRGPNPDGVTTVALANPVLNDSAFARGAAEAQAAAVAPTGMTATGTYLKAFLLLVLVALAGAFGWSQVQVQTVRLISGVEQEVAIAPDWIWIVTFLTFIVAIIGAFAVRHSWLTGPLYALGEGTILGVVSRYYDLEYDGIVVQAVLATLAVFLVMLVLYTTGVVKVTPRYVIVVVAAMGALLLLYVTTWILALLGANITFWYEPTPLGIALSVGIVILGALNLPIDFSFINGAAQAGAPKFMEWYGAYGLMIALVWIYVAILRLLALLRSSQ
jgi:uncharacterized YccA/Bax inhibitor family protein